MLRIGATMVASVVLTACLFPSFDDLRGGTSASDPDASADPPVRAVGATASTSSGIADAGKDASVAHSVKCGEERCGPSESCCIDFVGKGQCQPSDSSGLSCVTRAGCDDQADCGPGLVCCGHGFESQCSATCDAMGALVLCTSEDPRCPDSTACTGEQTRSSVTFRYCQ
jgi:hypothetical protein